MTFLCDDANGFGPVASPVFDVLLGSAVKATPFLIPEPLREQDIALNVRELSNDVAHQLA
jgi:hypothetical protein